MKKTLFGLAVATLASFSTGCAVDSFVVRETPRQVVYFSPSVRPVFVSPPRHPPVVQTYNPPVVRVDSPPIAYIPPSFSVRPNFHSLPSRGYRQEEHRRNDGPQRGSYERHRDNYPPPFRGTVPSNPSVRDNRSRGITQKEIDAYAERLREMGDKASNRTR